MSDICSQLTIKAATFHLPMWTEWGVRDVGHLVHSLGCTFLTAAGRDLGFAAVSEVPAPREGPLAHVEEDVRSDSVWFDRTTRRVALVAEFERYAGKQKDLRPKVETLLLAQQRWACEDAILLLAYWSVGFVTLPDHDSLRSIVRGGFSAMGGVRVPGNPKARLMFYQFVVRAGQDGLIRLENIIRRGEP
ncbi:MULTISPECIES: hypothetical protein [Azospirillum]|uniref:Uncharacterized protein n=2 Tax=Azospirillum brasilense TaxID=192 RepID=A0ABU4PA13_AZOBR|nr:MULTISPECIES: hypothetical protein [Azospirillum]MDW7552755.1 hypothetical protein [Azospirillum brasilense]MDW7592053.1 hypothetical protein [Azospirillum brasilense]MDW7627670.1 hypothetical protein [Azospirillum brasilense]MDX5952861.1 hypothetical protein [Azospirillum brasilense]